MRRSIEENQKIRVLGAIVCGALACIGAIAVCVLAFSALSAAIDLPDGVFPVLSGTALSAGCYAAAYTVAKKRRKSGLVTGLLCGGGVFLAALLLGVIFVRSFSAEGFFLKLLTVLICSAVGGIIGVNSPKKL